MTDTPRFAARSAVVETSSLGFLVELEDGSTLVAPWSVAWPLEHAPAALSHACHLTLDRTGITWPGLMVTIRLSHLYELAKAGGQPLVLPAASGRSAA